MELTLETKHVKALLIMAGKQDIRYYLNGLAVETSAEGVKVIATNGHAMAVLTVPGVATEAPYRTVILPRAGLELAVKAAGRADKMAFRLEAGAWFYGAVSGAYVEGVYPDWRRILPPIPAGPVAMPVIAQDLLDQVSKVSAALGGKYRPVIFRPTGGAGIVYVEMPKCPEIGLAIMPMRDPVPEACNLPDAMRGWV